MFTILLIVGCVMPGGADAVRYDRLTLLDGQVITGQVIEENAVRLMVRVVRMGGRVSYTRAVQQAHIAERGYLEVPQTPQPPPALVAGAGADLDDPVAFAIRTFDEWSIRNIEVASRRLLQLITRAEPAELERIDVLVRRGYDIPLAEFAAMVHLEYSLSRARDGHFRLYFVTPYTAQASFDLLQEAIRTDLAREVPCEDPAAHRSGGRGATVGRWLDQPNFYQGNSQEAFCFAKQISRLLGMNRELGRLAQALHRPRPETTALNVKYQELRALLEVVNQRKQRSASTP